jgi:hypothetical protein
MFDLPTIFWWQSGLVALAVLIELVALFLLWRKVGSLARAKGHRSRGYQLLAVLFLLAGQVLGAAAGAYLVVEIMNTRVAEGRQPEGWWEAAQERWGAVPWREENESPLAVIYAFGVLGAAVGAGVALLFANDLAPKPALSQADEAPARPPRTGPASYEVQARYQGRMKPRRVYPVFVELREAPRGPVTDTPLQVRLLAPGAQVTPEEAPLDVAQPGAWAMFLVTPLAYGWLNQARVEVRHRGRLVQRMLLPLRGSTQWLTWVLGVLTVLVPLLVLHATRYYKLPDEAVRVHNAPQGAAAPPPAQPVQRNPGDNRPRGLIPLPVRPKGAPPIQHTQGPPTPGGHLENEIHDHVYLIPYVTQPLTRFLGTIYNYACTTERHEEDLLAFWIGVLLLAGTAISWVRHLGYRGRRVSKPFGLAPAADAYAGSAVPLAMDEPAAAVPVKK